MTNVIQRVVDKYSKVSEEEKIKVEWKEGQGPLRRKSDFGASKAYGYQDAPWDWVVKQVSRWKSSNKPRLYIRVLAWDTDGKAAHDKFGKDFDPNEFKKAKIYAFELVNSGKCNMTCVYGRAYHPDYVKDMLIQDFGSYEKVE